MQDAIVEDKSGLSQILSSFKEHVILFDEKELKRWPTPDFPQHVCIDAAIRRPGGRVESGTETETGLSPTGSQAQLHHQPCCHPEYDDKYDNQTTPAQPTIKIGGQP